MDSKNQTNPQEIRFEETIEKAFKNIIGIHVFYEELLNSHLYFMLLVSSFISH